MAERPPNLKPFSQRRRQVQERRRARRRRKKLGEGLQLIFGGGTQMAVVFAAAFLAVSGLWLWRHEIKGRMFGAPSASDWEAMSEAVTHRDLALCDRINESVTLWNPAEFPALPARTLRDECRERIIARSRADLHQAPQPLGARWPSEPAIAGWEGYKPKKLGEYDRLGEIIQTAEPAADLKQNLGLKAQQRQQSQAPAMESQRIK